MDFVGTIGGLALIALFGYFIWNRIQAKKSRSGSGSNTGNGTGREDRDPDTITRK